MKRRNGDDAPPDIAEVVFVLAACNEPDQIAAQQMVHLEATHVDHAFDARRPHDRIFASIGVACGSSRQVAW